MQFLSGLDDTFSQVKSHIFLIEPLPSVKIACSIVSPEESRQKGGSYGESSTKPQAFNDQKKNKFRGNSNLQCKHCGLKGHTIEICYKLNGYPKDLKFRNENQNSNRSISGNVSVTSNFVETSVRCEN